MTEVKWIKIVTDIFDDEKILLIDSLPERDAIIVIWFKILCLAGKQNNGGVLMFNERIPYTDEMLATIFRRPVNTVRLALKTFEEYGMIEIVNHTITIPKWEKHQQLDGLEKVREQTRIRVARHKEKQKELAGNVTVTFANADRLDKDKNKNISSYEDIYMCEKESKSKKFVKPTLEEVRAYCRERNNNVDPESFIAYYESNGWKVGRNSMKNWKAAVRTWERNGYGNSQPKKEDEQNPYAFDNI